MQFSNYLLAAALAASANAVLNITNTVVNGITAGTPYTVTWGDAEGPVTLTLQNGDPLALTTYEVLVNDGSFPSGSFTWTPSSSLPTDNYNFKVEDGVSDPNYSAQFEFFGASSSVTSGTVSTTETSSTASVTSTVTSSDASTTGTTTGSVKPTSTGTTSKTSSTTSAAGTQTSAPAANPPSAAAGISSPIAMVFLAFAALITFN